MRILLVIITCIGLVGGQTFPFPGPGNPPSAPVTLYYGYGCNGTTTNTCTIAANPLNALVGFALAAAITTGSNPHGYDVTACGVYFSTLDATSKGFSCALYIPGIGFPPSCVVTAGTNATSTGWSENLNFSACHLAASTAYTVCYQVNGSGTAGNRETFAGGGEQPTASYPTTFPNPESFSGANTYSQYIKVTPTP